MRRNKNTKTGFFYENNAPLPKYFPKYRGERNIFQLKLLIPTLIPMPQCSLAFFYIRAQSKSPVGKLHYLSFCDDILILLLQMDADKSVRTCMRRG